jgi:hypothetical protein
MNGKGIPVSGMIFFGFAVGLLLANPAINAHAATSKLLQDNFQLSVIPIASKLPADSKEYFVTVQLQTPKDSKPIEAPFDIPVTLLASDATIIAIQNEIVIQKGESMANATIVTTEKAGNVEITALADGVRSGITSINTVRLDSLEPSKLAIYAGSGSFVPNPSIVAKMYVQLLNSADVPAVSKTPITVYLSSADTRIGSVPKSIVIPAGVTGTTINFTPTYRQGTTTIVVDSNGLAPGQVSVSTEGPLASKIVVEFAPSTMPAPAGFNSAITLQIRDSNDVPVKADQEIAIKLSSSDTDVAEVPSYITIKPGSSYALGKVESNGKIGAATITASASGLVSGFATVNTVAHTEASAGASKKITVFAIPSVIVPDNNEKATVVVQITDSLGNAYTSQQHLYYSVFLSSSDPTVGTIDKSLHSDMTYATTTFKSSFQSGKTTITASGDGYSSGQALLNTKGSVPFALKITQMPNVVVANGEPSTSVILSLLDEKEKPIASQGDVVVSLSSSDQSIASVEATEIIAAGKSYVAVEITPTLRAGQTSITASASGLASSSVEFKTVGSSGEASQYKLGISAVPKLSADNRTSDAVFVQLQDSSGNAVPAKTDINVMLSSSSSMAGSIDSHIVIAKGSSFAVAKFTTTTTPIKFKVTASSPGFATVETNQETTVQPLTIVKSYALPSKTQFDTVPVAVDVYSGMFALSGAKVEIGGLNANVTSGLTDENGHVESSYVPTLPGRNSITIAASKPGYEVKTESSWIQLDQLVDIRVDATTEGGRQIELNAKVTGPSGSRNVAVKATSAALAFENAKWGTYRISVPDKLTLSDARYEFAGWSDGMTENPRSIDIIDDSTVTAVYSAEYLLQLSSDKGIVSGGGYYAEGETAIVSISTTEITGFPLDSSFGGWTGDVRSSSSTMNVLMDGPKSINAEWQNSYLKLFGMVGAVGAAGVITFIKVIRPRRKAQEKARAPDLDWYKS